MRCEDFILFIVTCMKLLALGEDGIFDPQYCRQACLHVIEGNDKPQGLQCVLKHGAGYHSPIVSTQGHGPPRFLDASLYHDEENDQRLITITWTAPQGSFGPQLKGFVGTISLRRQSETFFVDLTNTNWSKITTADETRVQFTIKRCIKVEDSADLMYGVSVHAVPYVHEQDPAESILWIKPPRDSRFDPMIKSWIVKPDSRRSESGHVTLHLTLWMPWNLNASGESHKPKFNVRISAIDQNHHTFDKKEDNFSFQTSEAGNYIEDSRAYVFQNCYSRYEIKAIPIGIGPNVSNRSITCSVANVADYSIQCKNKIHIPPVTTQASITSTDGQLQDTTPIVSKTDPYDGSTPTFVGDAFRESRDEDEWDGATIAGAVVGAVCGAALVAVLLLLVTRRKLQSQDSGLRTCFWWTIRCESSGDSPNTLPSHRHSVCAAESVPNGCLTRPRCLLVFKSEQEHVQSVLKCLAELLSNGCGMTCSFRSTFSPGDDVSGSGLAYDLVILVDSPTQVAHGPSILQPMYQDFIIQSTDKNKGSSGREWNNLPDNNSARRPKIIYVTYLDNEIFPLIRSVSFDASFSLPADMSQLFKFLVSQKLTKSSPIGVDCDISSRPEVKNLTELIELSRESFWGSCTTPDHTTREYESDNSSLSSNMTEAVIKLNTQFDYDVGIDNFDFPNMEIIGRSEV